MSPGPGLPCNAGIMPELIKEYASSKSILGVCLGHQAIAEAFGASLVNMNKVLHGISNKINISEKDYLFKGIPRQINVGHYHSWMVDKKKIPDILKITAIDSGNRIMAISHTVYDIRGIQFHPESVLTDYGDLIIKNWLEH